MIRSGGGEEDEEDEDYQHLWLLLFCHFCLYLNISIPQIENL